LGILKLASEHGWKVDFIEETVSERVSYKERELGKVVKELKEGDILIVSELSRLGRSMLEIMTLLCELVECGVKLYAIKGNHRVDNSIQSKVMTMVLCMAAEIERELISQRTKEALQRKKREGFKLGRPKGVPGKSKLDGKEEEIRRLLDKEVGIASLAKIYDCSWPTMKNFINKKVIRKNSKV
jgi:putative DNA-invertase from lambdoid prophage Rac